MGPESDSRGSNSTCNVLSFKSDITKKVFIMLVSNDCILNYFIIVKGKKYSLCFNLLQEIRIYCDNVIVQKTI